MEEFFEAVAGGAIWGVGFAVALGAVRSAGGGLRPVAKRTIKGALAARDWVQTVTAESRENIEDLYHEARAEMDAAAEHEPATPA
jgi:hypothetical protein